MTVATEETFVLPLWAVGGRRAPLGDLERFVGWPVFVGRDVNREARRGIPRAPSELAGEVVGVRRVGGEVRAQVVLVGRAEAVARRLPRALRLVVDEASECVVLEARRSGVRSLAGPIQESEEQDMSGTMTLREALQTPEVRAYLREIVEDEIDVVVDEASAGGGDGGALRESVHVRSIRVAGKDGKSRPLPGHAQTASDFLASRGLDPALFGLPAA